MPDDADSDRTRVRPYVIGAAFALAVSLVFIAAFYLLSSTWEERGQRGDWLGSTLAAGAGLASTILFFGALLLQREELRAQREDLRLTRSELEEGRRVQIAQREEMAQQAKNIERQAAAMEATTQAERSVATAQAIRDGLRVATLTMGAVPWRLSDCRKVFWSRFAAESEETRKLIRADATSGQEFDSHIFLDRQADQLQHLGLMAMAGALDLRILMHDSSVLILQDWLMCRYRIEAEKERTTNTQGVFEAHLHAQWLGCIASLFFHRHSSHQWSLITRYSTMDIEECKCIIARECERSRWLMQPGLPKTISLLTGIPPALLETAENETA